MTNVIFSPTLQAPIVLSNPTGAVTVASDASTINAKTNPVPNQGAVALIGAAVRLALAMSTNAGALSMSGAVPGVIRGTVTKPATIAGATAFSGLAPNLSVSTTSAALTFPRIALVGNGGDQSYGSNASTGFPAWTTAASGSAARAAIQSIGNYDLAILAGVFEGWDTSGSRDRENLAQALLKVGLSYTVPKNLARPTLSFFYHVMNEGDPSGSGTGYDLLIAQINAMNGWMYESIGGTGTKTPSAASHTLINYSTAWPGVVGSAQPGESIVGRNYGTTSNGSPTGAQGVARTNGNYAADKLLIRTSTGDTRWSFNAQMAAPSSAGIFLDNCFVALNGGGAVPNSSLDGLTLAPGSQQGGGFPALDTVQPLLARGIHNFFDQMQTMTATYGTPGKVYYNFGNIGQYGNKYQFGTATLTCGLENTMHGGLLEDVIGAGAPSWEYQQTGKAGGGNWLSGAPNVLANYYQAMDFCLAPKLVVLAIRLPAADGSQTASWVNGGGSTLVTVTAGTALEYQEMRYGLCNALMDDGWFGVGVSGYDWSKPRWYDEYGDDSLAQVNVKRGYMGLPVTARPTAPTWVQGPIGVYSRAFTGTAGVGARAIWNPRGNGAQTVALGGTYKKLQGTQQPTINNGATVTSVTLADGDGLIVLGPFTAPTLTITTVSLPNGTVGTAYSATMAATGGFTPYTWSMTSATPNTGNWLSISSAGVLSGTPGTAETESVTIKVTDAANNTASVTLGFSVTAVSAFTPLQHFRADDFTPGTAPNVAGGRGTGGNLNGNQLFTTLGAGNTGCMIDTTVKRAGRNSSMKFTIQAGTSGNPGDGETTAGNGLWGAGIAPPSSRGTLYYGGEGAIWHFGCYMRVNSGTSLATQTLNDGAQKFWLNCFPDFGTTGKDDVHICTNFPGFALLSEIDPNNGPNNNYPSSRSPSNNPANAALPFDSTFHWIETMVLFHANGDNAIRRVWVDTNLVLQRAGRVITWRDTAGNYHTQNLSAPGAPSLPSTSAVMQFMNFFTYWNAHPSVNTSVWVDDLTMAVDESTMTVVDNFGNKMIGPLA